MHQFYQDLIKVDVVPSSVPVVMVMVRRPAVQVVDGVEVQFFIVNVISVMILLKGILLLRIGNGAHGLMKVRISLDAVLILVLIVMVILTLHVVLITTGVVIQPNIVTVQIV